MVEATRTESGALAASTVRFIFEGGDHRGEVYTAHLDVCSNPTCGCGVMWLDAQLSADVPGVEMGQRYRIPLDVIQRKVPEEEASGLALQDRNFARAMERELDRTQWKELLGRFFALKAQLVDDADLGGIDAEFPEHDIEIERLLVGYHDVFPFGRQISLQDGALVAVAFDQYCVRAECRCTEAALDLVAPGGEKRASLLVGLMFDHRASTWKRRPRIDRSPAIDDEAISRLLDSDPALASTLRARHRLLRRLYARYRRTHAAPPTPARADLAAVGRNEPCPCGSGRKYKHCCGG
jgi:hypothetical protein